MEPELSDAEKAAVRPLLLQTIFHVPHAVSTPLGVCTASVANWDFPEAWPEVLPFLLAAIQPGQPGCEVRAHLPSALRVHQQVRCTPFAI